MRHVLCSIGRRLLVATALLGLSRAALAGPPAGKPASLPDERQTKAEYLLSFGRYVEWPEQSFAESSGKFVVAVVGDELLADAIERVASRKMVQDRKVVVQRYATDRQDRQPCQVLFAGRALAANQQQSLIQSAESQSTLVVGETAGFTDWGGIVNFYSQNGQVRFEINAGAASRRGLHIDAKLLNLGEPAARARRAASVKPTRESKIEPGPAPRSASRGQIGNQGN